MVQWLCTLLDNMIMHLLALLKYGILEYKLILILFSFKNEYVEGVIAGAKAAAVATIATAIPIVSHFSHNCIKLFNLNSDFWD